MNDNDSKELTRIRELLEFFVDYKLRTHLGVDKMNCLELFEKWRKKII